MKTDAITKDCWIMGQLTGIQILEQELTAELKAPGARTGQELRRRIAQLNSWLNVVENVLAIHARKPFHPVVS